MKKETTFSAVIWSKRSKRYVSLTLIFSLLLGTLGMCMLVPAASAAETADGLVYEETSGEITITGYTGVGGEVEIPAEIAGKPVTEIAQQAFYATSFPAALKITKITIPNSVKTMGSAVFFGCSSLQEVVLPEGVSIPSTLSLFKDCTALKNITIPKNVTEIGIFMFQNCSSLTNVTFSPNNQISTVRTRAFQNCVLLSEIILPEKLH